MASNPEMSSRAIRATHYRQLTEKVDGFFARVVSRESAAMQCGSGCSDCCHYGLSATVWTNNLQRAHSLAASLQAGIVWINTWMLRDLRTPFGGVKNSGVGREGGWEALRFFTEAKNVTMGW